MRAAVCKTLTSVSYSQSLTEMERSRLALVVLMCVLLFSQNRISGAEVEMKVRPGDNITLYYDRPATLGSLFVWIRNCSHENQPSLIISVVSLDLGTLQRFSSDYNRSSNSYDLHITNISASDLGVYYCAEVENKAYEDGRGRGYQSKVCYYGNRTTRVSFAEEVTPCSGLNITSTPRVSDCVLCWTLLFSVCPVCVLLSSICVYCLCQRKTADSEQIGEILTANVIKRDPTVKHQCEKNKTGKICLHTEVSYRLLTSSYPYAKM
ncbi:uncharacterized protein LOC125272525 isoform X2 [Megalobrama amblycephala]|uniref:uncharacterized protein LOC125272525 isoform X2 n=1 Tax=Megalobrama amblycephala TaxID=75352 RepID=UPI0020141C84|nr:uncharacterized protein LOC125272525 isoform X2 [Megalobrama amblycephala]